MKIFKTLFIAVILICLLSTSVILCACNTDGDQPSDSNGKTDVEHPSGDLPSGEEPEIIEPYKLALTKFYLKDQNPHITDYFDDESKLNLAEEINSLDELKSFCQEKQLKFFDETDKTIQSDYVSKKIKTYDEDFFQKRSIVLVFRFNETTNYYAKSQVDIKDCVMNINLTSCNGNATTAIRTCIRIYELSKEIAQEITQIKVQESLGELDQKIGVKIYEGSYSLNTKIDAPSAYIIKSFNELTDFCDGETSPLFEKELTLQELIDQYNLTNLPEELFEDEELLKSFMEMFNGNNKEMIESCELNKYDEQFFQNKSLVLVFKSIGNNSFYSLESFDINNGTLDLVLTTPRTEGYFPMPDVLTCLYFFEINKEDVANVTQINVEYKYFYLGE